MPYLTQNDIRLHHTDEGNGEPVLLIHGYPLSHAMWQPQRAALSAGYRVIAPDLRGHGLSDAPTGPITVDVFADDLAALLDALGIGQATVMGLSMGGYVTMALLRRHPQRIRAVALLATKMTADTATGRQGRNEMIILARTEGAAAIADAMLPKMLTEATRSDNPELAAHVHGMMAATPVAGIVGALEALRERPDATATLAAARLPALIVVGENDGVTPPSEAEAMQRTLPGAQLVRIPAAAHLLTLEQPAAVNEALGAFLGGLAGM